MKRIRLIAVLAFIFGIAISLNSVVKAETNYGSVTTITQGGSVEGDATNDVKLKYESATLEWAPADPDIGRNRNGYWIGYRITAPTDIVTDETTAKKATYKTRSITSPTWSEPKSFFDSKDGEWFLNLWAYIDEVTLDAYKEEEEITLQETQYDWTGEGTDVQTVSIVINPKQITLTPDEDTATVTIKQRGNNASSIDTVFTVEKDKTLYETLGSVEKATLESIQAREGFKNFYKMNDGETFDESKIETYQEFDPESDIIEDDVTIVAYINIVRQPIITPEPDQEQTPPPATTEQKDTSPKTGNVEIIGYVLVIALISAGGIFVIRRKH